MNDYDMIHRWRKEKRNFQAEAIAGAKTGQLLTE